MADKEYIDIDSWERKEHFHFFKGFNEPFFGVTVEVDCTKAYHTAKKSNYSFFLYYLHKTLQTINSIDALKLRMEDDKVAKYDRIDASPTIPRPNGTFGFSHLVYYEDISTFISESVKVIEKVKKGTTLNPGNQQNVVHVSALPWLKFTSISHARHFAMSDSIPKISFGKTFEKDGNIFMPVSIHVNHALVDGSHVGKFVELFQHFMDSE